MLSELEREHLLSVCVCVCVCVCVDCIYKCLNVKTCVSLYFKQDESWFPNPAAAAASPPSSAVIDLFDVTHEEEAGR